MSTEQITAAALLVGAGVGVLTAFGKGMAWWVGQLTNQYKLAIDTLKDVVSEHKQNEQELQADLGKADKVIAEQRGELMAANRELEWYRSLALEAMTRPGLAAGGPASSGDSAPSG